MLTPNRKWDWSFVVFRFVTSFQTGPFCYWRRRRRDKCSHFCWSSSKDSATWWHWRIYHGCAKVYKSLSFLFIFSYYRVGRWAHWTISVCGMIIRVEARQHHGFSSISLCATCKQWNDFILSVSDGWLWKKKMALLVPWVFSSVPKILFFLQQIERLLPVAGELQKQEFAYVLSKKAYHSVSEGHLWFSIFARPPSNKFTRVQRCTCCFVLLFINMLLNILYYDQSKESSTVKTGSGLSLGPLYITSEQVCHPQ